MKVWPDGYELCEFRDGVMLFAGQFRPEVRVLTDFAEGFDGFSGKTGHSGTPVANFAEPVAKTTAYFAVSRQQDC